MGLTPKSTVPGYSVIAESEEVQVWWAGRNGENNLLAQQGEKIVSTAVDSGNTPNTTLRGGNLIGANSSGNNDLYDPDGTTGLQVAHGIIESHLSMFDSNSVVEDKYPEILVRANLRSADLQGLDAQGRAQLIRQGFKFDTFPDGAAFMSHPMGTWVKTADYTVVAADNGKLFIANGGGAIDLTLPTIAAGLQFDFLNIADQNMVVTGSNNIIALHDVAASTITFSTASKKIGARVRLLAIYTGTSTLKWAVEFLNSDATATIA